MAFIETPRFPDDISYGSAGGPSFKTYVFEGSSGLEQRNITWSEAKHRYDVSHGVKDKTDMDVIRAFFYNVSGRAHGFRFKDWGDYELLNENIGTGDGVVTTFLVTKKYVTGTSTYTRRIFKPISTGFEVRVNGVLKTAGSHYNLTASTGTIVFTAGNIPGVGEAVTVTGEFDVPVRFDTDALASSHDGYLTESWGSIPIIELRLED